MQIDVRSSLVRVVIQRVSQAHVTVDGCVVGRIGQGLLALVGIAPDDGPETVEWMAHKLVNLRVFADKDGKFNRSLLDVGGSMLVVSQFTLFGDCRKGSRPSFTGAAKPGHAERMYEFLCERVAAHDVPVERGVFAAHMDVSLVGDGPVTLVLER